MQTTPNFDRIGEENAFDVLARAGKLAEPRAWTSSTSASASPISRRRPTSSRPPSRRCATATTATPPPPACRNSARPSPPTSTAASKREVSPDNVLIVPGGKVTMFFAILMFGEPGAEILYPNPGFPIYQSMIEFTGARPIPVPIREENDFRLRRRRNPVADHPADPPADPQLPGQPDRRRHPEGRDRQAGRRAWQAHPQVAIMSDEIYAQMLYDGEEHVQLLTYPEIRDRLILLDGWSKTYAMTGWRLGYSVWPQPLYDKARKLAVNCWSCVNAPSQFAALEALTGPQDAVADMVAEFDARRRLVVDLLNGLPGVSCVTPKGAFYAFPNVSGTGRKAKALASDLLEEAGVATIGGPDFGVLGEGYIRLSYANSQDNIRRAIKRMEDYLNAG